jgi:isopentenyldiphosphate isomerase
MNDELLYEVDENDQPVGPRARGELHRLGLRHRAVHILVFNGRGELFLQKRSMAKDINPGLWDTSAAGHVDFGESYDQCAGRELGEELGIADPPNLQCLFKLPASEQTGWEFVQVYRAVHGGPLDLNGEEIDEGRWFRLDEMDAWLERGGEGLTSSFRVIWEAYRRFLGRCPHSLRTFSVELCRKLPPYGTSGNWRV